MTYDKTQAIYSSTALASRQREVKDAAREGVVHITENGNGAFVFCSEDVFAAELERARESARYEAELGYVLRRAAEDVAAGRYETDFAEFRRSVTAERTRRG
ncbi:MAG TPA: hypothetical protein DCP91_00310 [Eggerthellaceae bacterium]|nr:hypothetical protein [Eggerthellaceae bacterium]